MGNKDNWAKKRVIDWELCLWHGGIEIAKEVSIIAEHSNVILTINERLVSEVRQALVAQEVGLVRACLIGLAQDDMHRDIHGFERVDYLSSILWIGSSIWHIFAENTNSGILLNMLEVL